MFCHISNDLLKCYSHNSCEGTLSGVSTPSLSVNSDKWVPDGWRLCSLSRMCRSSQSLLCFQVLSIRQTSHPPARQQAFLLTTLEAGSRCQWLGPASLMDTSAPPPQNYGRNHSYPCVGALSVGAPLTVHMSSTHCLHL